MNGPSTEGQCVRVAVGGYMLLASVEHSGRRAVPVEEENYVHAAIGDRGPAGHDPYIHGL